MGQKINPISVRLGYSSQWRSRWFDLKNYSQNLLEDYKIREFVRQNLKKAAVAKVEIERLNKDVVVNIHTARPGVIIGRGGSGVEDIRKQLKKAIGRDVKLEIIEVKHPESNASIIAFQIAEQIEKRIPFRRAIRNALDTANRSHVDGIKIVIGGRLNGAEISRKEMFINGKVPLHTLRHFIDYAARTAYTTYGTIGIKVWVYKEGEKETSADVKSQQSEDNKQK